MAGFSDQNVSYQYTGATVQQYGANDYRFRVSLPQFGQGNPWPMTDTRIRLVDPSGVVTVIDPSADANSQAYWDANNSYLWIKPAAITSWSQDLSGWRIHLAYRPIPSQEVTFSTFADFDPAAIAAQLDLTTRLAQIALEVARRALVIPPEDEAFTGREVADGSRLLPRPADRALKALAWDATGTKLVPVVFSLSDQALAIAAITAALNSKPTAALDTAATLGAAGASDTKVASQLAVKTYVDRAQVFNNYNAGALATGTYSLPSILVGATMVWQVNATGAVTINLPATGTYNVITITAATVAQLYNQAAGAAVFSGSAAAVKTIIYTRLT